MAASRSFSGRGIHRYFSGDNELHPTTNLSHLTFEFNEFDVWSVASPPELRKTVTGSRISKKPAPETDNQREVRGQVLSLPVNVPDWSMILKQELTESRKAGSDDDDFDDDLYGSGDLIPPHEYLARGRITTFSVQEGFGRTLKGRDLSRVRNAVWKIIGFED